MRWGFDLDGCVIDLQSSLSHNIQKYHNIDLSYERVIKYDISEIINISKKEFLDCVDITILDFENIKPYNGSLDFLSYYYKKTRSEIIFITSRLDHYNTENWLKKHIRNIPYKLVFASSLYSSDNNFSKIDEIIKNKIEIFVEDNSETCQELSESNIVRVLCMNRPWNQDLNEEEYKCITRVKDWNEVKQIFDINRR